MAAIGTSKVNVLADEGEAQRTTHYRVQNFNTGDTLDVSDRFAVVEVATFIVSGGSTGVGTVTATTAGVLTLTLAGSTGVTGYLTVRGQSSTG